MNKETLAPATLVPSNPRKDEQVITGVAVCVVTEQLFTITILIVKNCDSQTAWAFAVITSPSTNPDTFILQALPEVTLVVPKTVEPFLYNVIVAVV